MFFIKNLDIRAEAEQARVKLFEIADKLGISDSSFSRKLRKEFTPDEKQRIRKIIRDLKGEPYNDEIEPIPRVCAARKERRKKGRRAAFVPGTRFKYSGFEWITLEETDGGALAVTAECLTDGDLDEFPFDENNKNDWRKSSLRKYLNGEFLQAIDADSLIKQTLDITADDGMREYGTSEDYVGILSCEQYRKYRDILPDYGCWRWTLTPWTCLASNSHYVRYVDTLGAMSSGSANDAYGVAPTLIIKSEVYNALQQEDQT